jgi:hypothetical protein
MVNTKPRTSNLELQTLNSQAKPPKAAQSHLKATPKPVDSQPIGTPKPPQCDPKATPKLPQSQLLPRWSGGQRRAFAFGFWPAGCRAVLLLRGICDIRRMLWWSRTRRTRVSRRGRPAGACLFRRNDGVGPLFVTDEEAGRAFGHAQLEVGHELPAGDGALLVGAAFLVEIHEVGGLGI